MSSKSTLMQEKNTRNSMSGDICAKTIKSVKAQCTQTNKVSQLLSKSGQHLAQLLETKGEVGEKPKVEGEGSKSLK